MDARRRLVVTAWSSLVIVDKSVKTEVTNMEAPYNSRELQGVCVISDEVEVHCMRYKGQMQGI